MSFLNSLDVPIELLTFGAESSPQKDGRSSNKTNQKMTIFCPFAARPRPGVVGLPGVIEVFRNLLPEVAPHLWAYVLSHEEPGRARTDDWRQG